MNEDYTKAAYYRDAVQIARNTPRNRHSMHCDTSTCGCWVVEAAYDALVKRFGPPVDL